MSTYYGDESFSFTGQEPIPWSSNWSTGVVWYASNASTASTSTIQGNRLPIQTRRRASGAQRRKMARLRRNSVAAIPKPRSPE